MVGMEVEGFLIDSKGDLSYRSEEILKTAKKDGRTSIHKEISMAMVEIAAPPDEKSIGAISKLLDELDYLCQKCENLGLRVLPLATYPGKYNPKMYSNVRYDIKKSILGKEKNKIEARICGFHCHSTLPHGIFDSQLRMLKILAHQKIRDGLVNSYNFSIAADPAFTCLMQSSPFYQAENIGNDSRVIMLRGGHSLENPRGAYADFEEFGGLPHYKLTTLDIIEIITTRYEKWKSYIKGLGLNIKVLSHYGSILAFGWGPLRIKQHGTLENRGMDMNLPSYVAGASAAVKSAIKLLQEETHAVIPSEVGIDKPFRMEEDVIFIPPYNHVKYALQKLSAYKGLEDDTVYDYCRSFLSFIEKNTPKDSRVLLSPFRKMLRERKTVSDKIIDFAIKNGWERGTVLSKKIAREITLKYSSLLEKDIAQTRKVINKMLN